MSYGVRFRVWGEFALFTRPEMKAERVSYDAPPASALRGVAEAIHWKPAIRYEIQSVAVLNPVRFASLRRNELGVKAACEIEGHRQQRAALVLRDVDYIVHAALELTDSAGEGESVAKHLEMFKRRLARGQNQFQPYLGCREFPAHCGPAPEPPPRPCAENMGVRPLGRMLREIRYRPLKSGSRAYEAAPEFFSAVMRDGVVNFFPRGEAA